jgi:hypothetical protein
VLAGLRDRKALIPLTRARLERRKPSTKGSHLVAEIVEVILDRLEPV